MKTVAILTAALGSATLSSAQPAPTANALSTGITASGISAGGFAAVQFHVAFSSQVSGVAALAAGPYYCSGGILANALTYCMQEGNMINVPALQQAAQVSAEVGDIDSTSNLNSSRVWLYSGSADTVVATSVVQATGAFYSKWVNSSSLTFISRNSQHTQLTTNSDLNPCTYLGSPYMGACGWSAAQSQLQWLYQDQFTPASPAVVSQVTATAKQIRPSVDAVAKASTGQSGSWGIGAGTLYAFDQTQFVDGGYSTASGLNPTGFVYIPDACNATAMEAGSPPCPLHVSFHGCNQQPSAIGSEFLLLAGYIEQASANGLVVLFPQANVVPLANPEGCFDWWGYTDANFPIKKGVQNGAFMAMAKAIAVAGAGAA